MENYIFQLVFVIGLALFWCVLFAILYINAYVEVKDVVIFVMVIVMVIVSTIIGSRDKHEFISTETGLTKTNTTSYTPTSDYNPATKKYVDDAITTAITTSLEGSY